LLDTLHSFGIFIKIHGEVPSQLAGVSADSRSVTQDSLFIARQGVASDGHNHISQALAKGANLIFAERMVPQLKSAPGYAIVSDIAKIYGIASSLHFGQPEKKLIFIGLTGTNGKTSTSLLLSDLLEQHQVPTMVIGTTGVYIRGVKTHSSSHTTPDALAFFGYLSEAHQAGVTHVIMEASSHGLAQERFFPAKLSHGIFTSFSQDHLDYHQTMEQYLQAKLKLFSASCSYSEARYVVHSSLLSRVLKSFPNLQDRLCSYALVEQNQDQNVVFSDTGGFEPSAKHFWITKASSAKSATITTCHIGAGTQTLRSYQIPFHAEFLLENTLAAILTFFDIRGSWPDATHVQRLRQIPGRMQRVPIQGVGPAVYVDYAHSPDALQRVLLDLQRNKGNGRLLLVFGCGGDRDRTKRPIMGAIAAEIADDIFLTSDNPRSESPEAILKEISRGIPESKRAQLIANRKEAIQAAIEKANPLDTILIAGKGHESGQMIGSIVHPFDDVEVARALLLERFPQGASKTEAVR
jgi:UDP-N-acetylmuramoyl-L-alanyl-D-glutamate--2,6-diaminopimelate ligase